MVGYMVWYDILYGMVWHGMNGIWYVVDGIWYGMVRGMV